jgi:hypothetical protein
VKILFGFFNVSPCFAFLDHPIGVAGLSIDIAEGHCFEGTPFVIARSIATKQSSLSRGFWVTSWSCHRAALRADPLARNDGD